MNAAIDQIKSKYNINEVVLAGHSGGALLVANLISKRSDVRCAVMGSGAIALGEYAYDSGFASEIWATWQDPMFSVNKIGPSPAEYYILAGQGDTLRPPKYQRMFADALAAGGLNVHFLVLRKRGDAHDHQDEVLKVADECAKRRSFEQIKRQLNVSKSQ
jgi:predicted esterase